MKDTPDAARGSSRASAVPSDGDGTGQPPAARAGTAAAALLAGLANLLLYLWRAAPGVTFEDSGELAAAAATGGVPHPPGYPLLMLVGRTWIALGALFTDDPARALNLLSAVCAAGAALLLAWTLRRLGAGVGAVLVAGLLPALAHTFAAQAVVTEVYALAALLQAAVLLVALPAPPGWSGPTAFRRAAPAAFLLGLAATAHQGSLLLAPLVVFALVREVRSGWSAIGTTARAALAFALGLLPYLYVPWAAASDPLLNWGEVTDFTSFFAHVARLQYEVGIEADRGAQLSFVVAQSLGQWTLASAAGLAAAAFLRGPRGRVAAVLLATLVLGAVGLTLALGFPVETEVARVRLAGSCVPLILLSVAAIGLGASFVEDSLAPPGAVPGAVSSPGSRSGALRTRATAALVALAFLGLGLRERDDTLAGLVDQRGAHWAESYGRAVLETAPPDAVVLVGKLGYGDVLGFPLLYRQVVFGERPDVLVLERGLLGLAWYRAQLARRHPELAPELAQLDLALEQVGGDPRAQRLAQTPFLRELFDGPRPVACVSRPGPSLLDGRELLAGSVFWHVLPSASARPASWTAPVVERSPSATTWLPPEDRDPWTALLRELADERRNASR